ncbi:MAG: Uncharacterised protein [Crocinitomicaceae bacterium]|nr:MAG: Uncharacterised protein [Crocinitomicaceae bacterium]
MIYDTSSSIYANEFDHNLWYGSVDNLIPFGINSINGLDPQFNNSGGNNEYDYSVDSLSPLFNSGKIINSNGGFDYFGNIVPDFQTPDIGFYEFPNNLTNTLSEIRLNINLIFPNPVDQFLLIDKKIY